MTLKDTLKRVKLNESTISMLLGALVIVVVGVAAVNFLGDQETGDTIPAIESENLNQNNNPTLPTEHTVRPGEDLWNISEQYYDTGYNWVAIAEANDISDPNQLEEGQTITIPNLEIDTDLTPTEGPLAQADSDEQETVEPTDEPEPTATISPTRQPTPTQAEPEMEMEDEQEMEAQEVEIEGETYTVVKGDTLWDIADRAYGDPYRWTEIAQANELVNPDLIHAGNRFTIPR